MLPFNHCRLIFFVHTLNGFSCIATKVLITWFYWIFYVNNLLLSKIFQINIFSSLYLFLVFINFDFHLINEANSHRIQQFFTKSVFHISQNDKEKRSTRTIFRIFSLKLFFLFGTNHRIKESTYSWDEFLMAIICRPLVFLFFSLFLDFKKVVLWALLFIIILRFFFLLKICIIIISILKFYLSIW